MLENKIKCDICGKFFKLKGLGSHKWRSHTEIGLKFKPTPRNTIPWNKGVTKENNESMKRQSNTLKFGYKSGRLKPSTLGKKLTDEHKQKISVSRIKFLKENSDMVPYKLNHSHKVSYPEKYFMKVLNGFIYNYKVPTTLYEIDFANIKDKIAIEIDGEQHYVDKRIIKHDIKRTKKLESLGWRIIRVRWSVYQKLNYNEKKEIINNLMIYKENDKKVITYKQYKVL